MRIGSLFSGYGGLDLAVTDVPGGVRHAQMRILSNGVVPQQAASGIWAALELLDRDLKGAA